MFLVLDFKNKSKEQKQGIKFTKAGLIIYYFPELLVTSSSSTISRIILYTNRIAPTYIKIYTYTPINTRYQPTLINMPAVKKKTYFKNKGGLGFIK